MRRDPRLNGGVLLGGNGREFRVVLSGEALQMLKFLSTAYGCTDGEMAQRILTNATLASFRNAAGMCVQRALEVARPGG